MMNKLLSGRTGYLLGFLGSFGSVGMALWIQTRYQLNPCPLCISQRVVLMGLGLMFLVAAIQNPAQQGRKIYALLHAIAALGGVSIAIRHWWLQAHRETIIADCGVGFDYMFENFPLQKALTLVFRGTGDCAAIDWTFLGITIPQLALMTFIGFAGYAVYLATLKK